MKRRILCFGDSLTWGYNPDNGSRHDDSIRWTGVLQEELGPNYQVLEEGQNGRTIATDDPAEGEKNGIKYILPCMESQKPFDVIVIMLGTNDLKRKFNYSAMDVSSEMELLIKKVMSFNHFSMNDEVKILLISPPVVGDNIENSWLGDSFGYKNACKVSSELSKWYQNLANNYNLDFIDAARYVKVSDVDSIHMDAKNNKILGLIVADKIRQMN